MRGARMNVAMSTKRATCPESMGSSCSTRGMIAAMGVPRAPAEHL